MNLLIGFSLVALCYIVNEAAALRRVCYYTDWAQWRQGIGKYTVENVDPHLCTHIVFAFAYFRDSGEIYPISAENDVQAYAALTELKQQNPDLKILLAIGGWNFGSVKFSNMVADNAIRSQFVRSAVTFLRNYRFDGLDLDWEYPGSRGGRPADKANLVILCQELKAAFEADAADRGKDRLLLTAAVPAGRAAVNTGYDVGALSNLLDFFSLMVYDLHGGWDGKTGHNSALYPASTDSEEDKHLTMDEVAKWWNEAGAPKSKIVVGMATYGHTFSLNDPSNSGVGVPATTGPSGQYTGQSGFWSYYEICLDIANSNGKVNFDEERKVPYYVKDTLWISYDNERSLRLKAQWLKREGYSGFMIWALDLDDFSQACSASTRKYPLINAIIDELGEQLPSTVSTAPTTTSSGEITSSTTAPTSESPLTTTIGGGTVSCSGKEDGYYPHPTDCTKYFQCVDGVTHEFVCPSGLHWDVKVNSCNWPALAGCSV